MSSNDKGLIFDIQRYAIHDGPGIRTIAFLKGCPLRCKWCANPESQKPVPEITYFENECFHCGGCAQICSRKAIAVSETSHSLNHDACNHCGQCIDICPTEALRLVGRYVSPKELFDEMATDQPFWKRSGGGVTLSGGEPLAQAEFALAFIKLCKEYHTHVVIESSLHVTPKIIREVTLLADGIICDVKIMDQTRHRTFTGVPNNLILKNLTYLLKNNKPVLVRMPLVPTINDDVKNLEAMGALLKPYRKTIQIELLPYHRLGVSKYARMERCYGMQDIAPPTDAAMKNAKRVLKKFNMTMTVT